MKKILISTTLTLFSLAITAQQKLADRVLFSVEDETISAGEYMAVYNKNRSVGEEIDPKTPEEYLDLYINFKLKVQEAKALGRDTLPGFKREYRNYRDQLAKPYLSDKDVTQDLIREAYGRMKYDIRASHIMMKLPENPTPEDTAAAYAQIAKLHKQVKDGADFENLARAHSDDTYSAERGGDLGFFTVFNMVYPFETAAYETSLGKISKPVRSQFGYHIVKPTEKRKARGSILVAHLMLIDKSEPGTESDTKSRINEIYQKLQKGEKWETLVKQYSEDKTSAMRDGVLDRFGINKMYPEFEEAAFALQDSGEVSAPVRTPVGWHLIKLIDKPGIPSFENAKGELRTKVERDIRAAQSQETVMKRLKREYQYQEFPKRYSPAIAQVDESLMEGKYKLPAKVKNADQVLFSFADKEYTVSDYLNFVAKNQKTYGRSSQLKAMLYRAMRDFQEQELLNHEKSKLSEKYPEFRMLEREYFEGILLFDLTEEKIWRQAMTDTAGLEAYFANHRDQYRWNTRVRGVFVDAATKKLAKKAKKYLKKDWSAAKIAAELNSESKLAVRTDSGTYEIDNLPVQLDGFKRKPGFTKIQKNNERYQMAQLLEVLPEGPKTLKEARGSLLTDYQNHLEEEWLADLKSRYEVNVNQEVLKAVIAELED